MRRADRLFQIVLHRRRRRVLDEPFLLEPGQTLEDFLRKVRAGRPA
jgi:hypothetical protein